MYTYKWAFEIIGIYRFPKPMTAAGTFLLYKEK
jgi:hypothetical protein